MNKHFIPVKITDKKWADKLVNGEVYMRALHEFGSWGNVTEKDTPIERAALAPQCKLGRNRTIKNSRGNQLPRLSSRPICLDCYAL